MRLQNGHVLLLLLVVAATSLLFLGTGGGHHADPTRHFRLNIDSAVWSRASDAAISESTDTIDQSITDIPMWLRRALDPVQVHPVLLAHIHSNAPGWHQITPRIPARNPPRALLYLGWLAYHPHMAATATRGGPTGEFVYWADLTAGLIAIGYNITMVDTIQAFWREIKRADTMYDIVLTDYDGLGTAENTGDFPKEHCKYYIVDGFGTQREFNDQRRRLDLRKILTPYPFDGSNTAINIMISTDWQSKWIPREKIGLLWAKDPKYLQRDHYAMLKMLSRIVPMHSFLTTLPADYHNILINHNTVGRSDFIGYIQRAYFIIGIGSPVDGPTALEAIAHGCAYINPAKYPPVILPNKPNKRLYTSQHPYIEENFGEPYAYTINITDLNSVSKTVRAILDADPKPFIHPMNSAKGYVDNLNTIFDIRNTKDCSDVLPVAHPSNPVFDSYEAFEQNDM